MDTDQKLPGDIRDWLDISSNAPNSGGDPASRAFETIRDLLRHPEPDALGPEMRDELKAIHPGLLEGFLVFLSLQEETSLRTIEA